MSSQPELRLLLDVDPEIARWRRRATFLFSVVLHGVLVALILFSPQLFRRAAELLGIPPERQAAKREPTFLWLPPEVLKRLREPPETDTLSDQNRRAQGRAPTIDPNGLPMPYSRGNTPLPEIAGGGLAATPPAPPAGGASAASPPPPKEESRLRLMDVPASAGEGGDSRLRLQAATPGEAIQQSLEAAARGRSGGPGAGPGDSTLQLQNVHPNFSTEAPLILSDTRGVDFGPYLARVVYNVRRNWYAMIPESARLGQKGRVALVFRIVKDGSVPELRLVATSGAEPLDRAALASIRASNPFPPLPEEFTGDHLVLQFIFLYNLGYGYGP